MSFGNITVRQQLLRARAQELDKEAGVASIAAKGLGLPFRAVGKGVGLAGRVAGQAALGGAKGAHRGLWALSQGAAKRMGGPAILQKPVAGLMYGGAALGGVSAAKAGIGKAREYKQGFNPAYQQAKLYGYGQ